MDIDDPLTVYLEQATQSFRRHRIYQYVIREHKRMSTPAAISRATAHAERVKNLMLKTEQVNTVAEPVLDKYEAALGRYESGIADINEKSKALEALLPAMGNAAGTLEDAFPGDKKNGELQVIKPEDVGTVQEVVDGGAPKSGG